MGRLGTRFAFETVELSYANPADQSHFSPILSCCPIAIWHVSEKCRLAVTVLCLTVEIPIGNCPNADQFCHPTLPIRLNLGVTSSSALAITCCGTSIGMLTLVPRILWRRRVRTGRGSSRDVRKPNLDLTGG